MYDLINVGAAPNDKTGDPIRRAFQKFNKVITDLNTGTGTFKVIDANTVAEAGQVLFVDASGSAVAITPPPSPVLGTTVEVVIVTTGNPVTFNSVVVDATIKVAKFTYVSQVFGWVKR
jgi:hypothetical protein